MTGDDFYMDSVGLAVGKTALYGGSSIAIIFGLTAYDLAAITGAVVAIAGLSVQWYYNFKKDKREEEAHKARMKRYLQ